MSELDMAHAQACTHVYKHAQACTQVHKHAQAHIHKHTQAFTSIHKHAQTCTAYSCPAHGCYALELAKDTGDSQPRWRKHRPLGAATRLQEAIVTR